MTECDKFKTGDRVRVLSFSCILATLDKAGRYEGMPFMPEMQTCCGRSYAISAILTKICCAGEGVRRVRGEPLIRLGDLRCDGTVHGHCSRLCTFLWKPSWLIPDSEENGTMEADIGLGSRDWPYPNRSASGSYFCQSTALFGATSPITIPGTLSRALGDWIRGDWGARMLLKAYWTVILQRLRSKVRRRVAKFSRPKPTPVQILALEPGEWVEVKSFQEIAATLDRNNCNRGLKFSSYMLPFCGGTYRVKAKVNAFIEERTGLMRELENTVALQGVTCRGETPTGLCRRLEYFYWREIWLKRTEKSADEGSSQKRP